MECIICKGPMETKVIEGVEIDYCSKCGGVWLDEGEMEQLSGLDPARGRILTCTACSGNMGTKIINDVEVDFCPSCGTVWLDRGELEKVSGVNPETGKTNLIYQFIRSELV